MSHIYQPVMLIELLEKNGSASVTEIAQALLRYDQAQIDYYEHVVKRMVGRVLTNNRGITAKSKDNYSLIGYTGLSDDEKDQLIRLCHSKIGEFLDKRGVNIWRGSKRSPGYISGSLRYEILKRAKFRCELCGISADEKALQVDHIIPRNAFGSDDQSNLQTLCYSCNAMKRDKDDTDFRGIRESYEDRKAGCIFCKVPEKKVIAENELAYAILDKFPVTAKHTLIIPKRHIADYFSLHQPERNAIQQLLEACRQVILDDDFDVTSFNIGNNVGGEAGQTFMHCHTHLIPRRVGDTEDPRGGVRGVIPGRQNY